MRPGRDLDVFGDLAVAGDPAVMRPIQPDDLGQQMRIRGVSGCLCKHFEGSEHR
jgi:hypothetical protein